MAFSATASTFGFAAGFARIFCKAIEDQQNASWYRLGIQFHLLRPRTGEKLKTLSEVIELTTRAAHEQEQFPPDDWEFIKWLAETHAARSDGEETMMLSGLELLHWLARWGNSKRLESASKPVREY